MEYTLWEKICGSRLIAEIDRLECELTKCRQAGASKDRRMNGLELEVKLLTQDIKDRDIVILELEEKILKLQNDASWYMERITALEEALAASVQIPDVSEFVIERKIVEPFQHPELGRTQGNKMVYDLEVGDLKYYAFPKGFWLQILDLIQPKVKEALGRVKPWINDCENFALTMACFIHQAFNKAGLDRQGALCILWSYKHAYNGFIDLDDKVWVFDPMLNGAPIIGELGSTPIPKYDTRMVWFSG